MVVFSIVSAYTIPSSTGKGGDVILEQAQQEEKTNPYNMPVGTEAPQSEAPAATTPAEAPGKIREWLILKRCQPFFVLMKYLFTFVSNLCNLINKLKSK